MDDSELNENGRQLPDDVLRFESLDDGSEVLAFAHATGEGQVSLALEHEMDGDLKIFMDPKTAEELALALARAADRARENLDLEENGLSHEEEGEG